MLQFKQLKPCLQSASARDRAYRSPSGGFSRSGWGSADAKGLRRHAKGAPAREPLPSIHHDPDPPIDQANWACSVLPSSAAVEAWPAVTVISTWSK
jgi:hypothetical protein